MACIVLCDEVEVRVVLLWSGNGNEESTAPVGEAMGEVDGIVLVVGLKAERQRIERFCLGPRELVLEVTDP